MHKKSQDALKRSDRVLVGALTVVLAAVSAAVGAAAAYHPHTEQVRTVAVDTTRPVEPVVPDSAPAPEAMAALQTAAVRSLQPRQRSAAEDLILNKLMAEHRCLSEVMYYEARGEGMSGQKAIAEVVFTRMRHGNYGHSICAVVYEGAGQPKCQFSFTCNGDLARKKQPGSWMKAQILAARILTGEEPLKGMTFGATNFHAASVSPEWADELARTNQIGNHIFYKAATARTHDM